MFLIRLSLTFTHALHHVLFALSLFPTRSLSQCLVVPEVSHGMPNFVCFYHCEF